MFPCKRCRIRTCDHCLHYQFYKWISFLPAALGRLLAKLGGLNTGGLGCPAVTAGEEAPEAGGEAPGDERPDEEEEVDHWLASGPRGSVFLAASCFILLYNVYHMYAIVGME